uniref:RNA-directed DNA polymerase n=1 Tax=Vitis vinifera TaxID=29760 RepID=A5BBQ6_VITVI|nr:hypothetical protein VITISV_014941 [Vitis vinifera]
MTVGRATCIVFSDDDLPPDGLDHIRPLYITIGCSGRRVPSVLLDNGSALNVCPLATAIALGFAPSDFGPSTQTVRAYDSTKRKVMGTLMIDLQNSPATFSTLFQVLRIPTSFNLLLGRPWIHIVRVIPSSLHQKVKFIHDGQVIIVHSTRDIFFASEPVLQISHSEDDLLLTGFTFDEIQTLEIEDFCRNFVAMSFDQHSSIVVLDMMRSMTFLPGMGLGRRQQGPSEFIAAIDHDTTFGLGFIPTEADYRYMALLPKERLSDGGHGASVSMATPTSPDRASMLSLYFPEDITDDRVIVDPTEMIDGVVPHDDYRDEMDMMTVSQITNIVQLQPVSAFDMFGVSTIEIFDIDDEIAQPGSDRDSFDHDSDPIDVRVSLATGDVETVDFGTDDQPRELKIGSPLFTDERDRLIHLLRSYLDVFAWSYEDMPVVEYPEWLANVVPVPKKDGKVRVCVDFRDLNKASPKDDFPLPHIDLLVDSTAGHSMLSFMDGFSRYNQILMALEDMEKTAFITEWGTYCYRVMPFGLKNAGATYQRAATTLFHDMMHKDVEVYVDDMIVKSRGRADHLDALERFFERIRKFRLRLNPKKCTFGVTSGKLFGHMVSERGIEVDPDKIKAILDMPAPKTEKEIRSFLGRLQYINRFIARLIDIFSDMALGCMLAQIDDSGKERAIYYLNKRMLEYEVKYVMIERLCLALVWATRRLRHYMTEYSVHLISRLDPLRYLFDRPALTGRLMRWLVLLTEFDIQYVSQRSIKGSIVADHLASLPTSEDRPVDDDFPDEEFVAMASLSGWCMYFDVIHPLLIELRSAPAYYCLIGETKVQDDLPWYRDIYQFLRSGTYPKVATAKDRRALRNLATRFVICGDTLYRRSADGMLLLCLDRASANWVMREVHAGVCGPHMGGHMLARKIMRTGYFWLTMETDCCQFVQKCPKCQIHGDLIHAPPSELHTLTSPWPFSVWGIDIIGKVSPKSSSGHEFILVAIDYFTKWVEAASYARLTSARVASFNKSHIICRYGVPHELISDRGVHFRAETNGAVEAANKNIKRILRKMVETSRDWSKKLPFALWAYRTSFRTSTGATPYSLVYGMEAVLPVEIEMGSLRVALEQQISETEWAQARFDQLNLLNESRLRVADHVQAYQRKMARAFKKRVKPRPLQKGDLVLRILRGLIGDPRGKFRPS